MRRTIFTVAATVLVIAVAAVYSAPKDVMERFQSNGWTFMVHLTSIPKEHRKMVNATHHLAVEITNPQGQAVSDMSVKFVFKAKGKIAAQGELKYMGGSHEHGGGHGAHVHGGHYGADITLPAAGDYNLTLTAKGAQKITVRAAGNIKVTE